MGISKIPKDSFFYVQRIFVEGLFGQYTYDLNLGLPMSDDRSKLLILYGDNGSGKTTLLRLVFHLLAHGRNRGHRGVVIRSSFKRILVGLGNDTEVMAQRPSGKTDGGFKMSVRKKSKVISSVDFILDEDGDAEIEQGQEDNYEHLLATLSELGVALYLLSDDRRLRSNQYSQEHEDDEELHEHHVRPSHVADSEVLYRRVLSRRHTRQE